jgi:hypothetical protein
MKSIAVMTDFSEGSVHATRYAMHIAKKMKANILLFSLSAVSAARQLQPVGGDGNWPESDAEDDKHLADFALRMELDMKERSFPGSFFPEVSFNSDSSEMVDVMTAIGNNSDVALVVTAPRADDDVADFMVSDHCLRIIDWSTVPVLVVPESTPVRNVEKMAFSTTFHEEDINSIAELGKLMEAFSAELMVAHLNEDPCDKGLIEAGRLLNRDLYKKIDCGGVYFRSIPDTRERKDWEWLKANKRTDMLVVVQQQKEAMRKFFTRAQGAQATYHITIPVMVLPKLP